MQKGMAVLALVLIAAAAGCREDDGPLSGVQGQLFASTDPEGAHILINGEDTGLLTPDTVDDVGGVNSILLQLDTAGWQYALQANVIIRSGQLATVRGPLVARCTGGECFERYSEPEIHANMAVNINALGPLFLEDGNGQGLRWPNGTNDTYVSNGMPVIAARLGSREVALGMYDIAELAGRPVPVITLANGELRVDQRTWIAPLSESQTLVTIRGIEVRQQVLIDESVPDVVLIRLTYRNITSSPLYQSIDARGAEMTEGLTYDDVYLGFALDPDIGQSNDDWATYDPALDAVIAYDASFSESGFTGAAQTAPGLIGLRMLSAPSGARVILNAYNSPGTAGSFGDWHAEEADEVRGWGVLSGLEPYQPDDPDQDIGMLVPAASDVRIAVSAGPYALRPAEEISIVVAVALARPVAGTFTSPGLVAPGSPQDPNRTIMQIAADLRAKLTAAATLLPKMTN